QRATADLTRARAELEAANLRLQQTTQDLNESKGLLQAVFDHSPNAIVVKNMEGKYLLTNRQFQQFLGFTEEELRGKSDDDVLTHEGRERHARVDEAAIKSGGPVTTEESGVIRGVKLSFLETVFPLQDANGETFGVCWIGTEISEIKRAEEALAQTAADLK